MNVLMFGWEFPPDNSGGLGVACEGLTRALSRQGTRINFILPKKFSRHVRFMKIHSNTLPVTNLELTAVNSLLHAYSSIHNYQHDLSHLNAEELALNVFGHNLIDEVLRYGKYASKWAKHISHNLIHTHDWLTMPAGINAARISGKPLITHVHATEQERTGGQSGHPHVEAIESEGLHKADHIITVSHHTKNHVIHRYGISPKKISVVHNGIDHTNLSPIPYPLNPVSLLPGHQIVLFVGRLTIMKGADYLLRAARLVLNFLPKTIFIFAGNGDMREQLIMEAAAMGIANRVVFPGFLRGQQLQTLYQAADIFVMPSVTEPFGLVALEAMQAGKPVIVSRQSGVSEIVNHAFKADFWDIHRLADLIISTLKYPALQATISPQASREANHHSWDAAAQKTLAVYHQLL